MDLSGIHQLQQQNKMIYYVNQAPGWCSLIAMIFYFCFKCVDDVNINGAQKSLRIIALIADLLTSLLYYVGIAVAFAYCPNDASNWKVFLTVGIVFICHLIRIWLVIKLHYRADSQEEWPEASKTSTTVEMLGIATMKAGFANIEAGTVSIVPDVELGVDSGSK